MFVSRPFRVRDYPNYINGVFVPPSDGEYVEVRNPATNEVVARVPRSKDADVDSAADAAFAAFESGVWRNTTAAHRSAVLERIADAIAVSG